MFDITDSVAITLTALWWTIVCTLGILTTSAILWGLWRTDRCSTVLLAVGLSIIGLLTWIGFGSATIAVIGWLCDPGGS